MLQVPNDQACAAMKGENFTATNGASYKFFANQQPLDSCFAPMNLLFTDISKMPMVAQSNLSAIFDAGKCLKGDTVLSWALEDNGTVQAFTKAFDGVITEMKLMKEGDVTKIVREGFEDMQKDFGPMCFHLANSVTDCVYKTSVAYAYSSDAPPPSKDTGSSGGGSSPSTKSDAAPGMSSIAALSLTVVASLAFAW